MCAVIGLQTEAVQRHIRRDQIVNGQIEGDHGSQMSRLVKGGAQRKVVTILPGQAAQGGETFTFIKRVGLLQHFSPTGIDNAAHRRLFKTRREIFKRQGRDQDHAVVLTVQVVHRPRNRLGTPQGIKIGRNPLRHLKRRAVMRAEYQRFCFALRLFEVIDILLETGFLQTFPGGGRGCRGDIVVDLPCCITPGIDAFMHCMSDIDNLIALVLKPGIDGTLDHHSHRD